jgi:hypothetical protein
MRPISLLPIIVGFAAGCTLPAGSASTHPARTEVVFDHPENFADVKDAYIPSDKGRDAILLRLREYLVSRADLLLPEGYNLKVTFNDIHLAGDFEPWRGANWDEVRIIKAIYPPSFKFTYAVTDKSGKVVKSGSEDILDLNFQMRLLTPFDESMDNLAYEKDILNDWTRSTLRNLDKT